MVGRVLMIHFPEYITIDVEHFTNFYLLPRDSLRPAVMVDAESLTSPRPETLDVGLENNLRHDGEDQDSSHSTYLQEGYDHTENKPNINHLDVSCLGQRVENTNVPWVK